VLATTTPAADSSLSVQGYLAGCVKHVESRKVPRDTTPQKCPLPLCFVKNMTRCVNVLGPSCRVVTDTPYSCLLERRPAWCNLVTSLMGSWDLGNSWKTRGPFLAPRFRYILPCR
jgi:hypothetical protein